MARIAGSEELYSLSAESAPTFSAEAFASARRLRPGLPVTSKRLGQTLEQVEKINQKPFKLPHFKSTLRIIREQYRGRDFGAVSGLHIGESNVF